MKAYLRKNIKVFVGLVGIWTINSINYFLLAYSLTELSGGLYLNTSAESISVSVGSLMGGVILAIAYDSKTNRKVKKLKFSLTMIFILCTVGSTLTLVAESFFASWTPLFLSLIHI